MKKLLVVIVLVFAVFIVLIPQTSAQNKVIYGCVGKVTGILRIVSGPTQCLKLETPISWNQVGPAGPQGIQGPAGTVPPEVYDDICQVAQTGLISPCPSFCICGPKIVFVSSAQYTGNLGGLAGADAKCQALAGAAGISGTFKAWLSDTHLAAKDRLTHSNAPYRRVDGVVVADDYDALITGHLQAPISIDEYGRSWEVGPIGSNYVWTSTSRGGWLCSAPLWPGPYETFTCGDWTSEESGTGIGTVLGVYGWCGTYGTDSWTESGGRLCGDLPMHLYCFEQ